MKKISSILLVILLLMNFWALFYSPVVSEGEHDREDEVVIGEIETDSLPKVFDLAYFQKDLRFPSDDSYMAVSIQQNTGSDGNISIINTTDFSYITNLTVPNSEFQFIDISDDDTYLAVASYDLSMAHIFWTSNWTFKQNLTDMTDAGHNVDFSSNGDWLAVVGNDQYIYIYDVPSFTLNTSWDTAQWPSYDTLWFSPDSQYLAHGEFSSRDIVIYWTSNWTEKTRFDLYGSLKHASRWSNNGTWLAVGDYDTGIDEPVMVIYRTSDFTEVADWTIYLGFVAPGSPPSIRNIDFSPDDKFIFVTTRNTVDDDQIVSVINTSNWETVATWTDINGLSGGWGQSISYNNQYFVNDFDIVSDKMGFRAIFNVTRDVDITPPTNGVTESETFEFTAQRPYTGNVTLKIPISSSVTGIINVKNETTGTEATSVEIKANLVNNTYYFDSANNYVYIETINLLVDSFVNWTVNCSYGMTFSLTLPTYLEVGDYFIATGLIKNATGVPVDGVLAKTRVLYSNGTDALATPPEWNCTNGNYYCVFSTSSLLPGVYSISIEFNYSGVTYKEGGTLYLSVDPGPGVHISTFLHFTFYNNNTGIGIPSESFKIYASTDTTIDSNDRIYVDLFGVYTGQTIYYRIDDYFDNQIYPTAGDYEILGITSIEQFEDVPIDWYSFSVKNMNHSIVRFNMTNGSRVYPAWLFPYEPFYWDVLSGEYNLSMEYYNPVTDAYIETKYENITVDSDTYYWIRGYDLRDIIIEVYAVNSTLGIIEINITTNIDLVNSTIDFINQTIWNELTFMNTSVGEVNTRIINIWTSQNSSFGNLENRSMIIFSVYNTNEALGLDRDTLKVYINGTRLIGNIYYANRTDVLNLTIKDYYNSTLYQGNHTVVAPLTFIDLGLTFHSWLFGNKNNIDYMISILKQGGSRWWERGIVPYGEREFIIPSGTYALRIYYNDSGVYTEIYNSTLPPSILVNCSKVYVIEGNDLVEVMSGLSIIRGQLIEVRTELYNAFMPDIEIMCRNPPMIYSIYDKEGMAFGNDFYKICPALITIATTRVTTYGNWINSTPMVPSNGTITNGTVTILRDALYLSGPSSITWVNITCADNNTLMQNTSYIPSRVDIYGQNLTINASGDISVMRETKYNQLRKFDWTFFPFSGYGPDPSRAGWHSAGIEFINPMPVPLYEVYGIAGFSNQSNSDGNSVVVRDTANGGVISKRGPDYDVTDAAIHFSLLSIDASSSRAFTIGYYKLSAESYTYSEGTVSIPDYDLIVWDSNSYNWFKAHWTNPYDTTFRGALYIKLNFNVPTEIDTTSMRIYDLTFDHELDPAMFIPGSEYIRISAEGMGDVLPGSGRAFDVYFLMTEYPGADPRELHLNTEIWMGITPFLIIFGIGAGFVILGACLAALDKKEQKDRWKASVSLGVFIMVIFYILSAMGL